MRQISNQFTKQIQIRSYRSVLPTFELSPNYKLPLRYIVMDGMVKYDIGQRIQETLVGRRIDAKKKLILSPNDEKLIDIAMTDIVILLQHPHTFTFGRRQYDEYLESKSLSSIANLKHVNRGGQTTYHGPGQLVIYPILNLGNYNLSVRDYVCKLEKTLMKVMTHYDLSNSFIKDTGIWVDSKKISSIGIHIQKRITSHGISINCSNDLSYYNYIKACGNSGGQNIATSLSDELNRAVNIQEVIPVFIQAFGDIFERRMVRIGPGKERESDLELF